jgi:hypothetical protein
VLATWQILDAATAARKRLLRAGYFPIPTNGKKPPIAGWTGIVATDATIENSRCQTSCLREEQHDNSGPLFDRLQVCRAELVGGRR